MPNADSGVAETPNTNPGASSGCPFASTEAINNSSGEWTVKSILDVFCKGDAEDREVVKKLQKLTIHRREPKQVHFKIYKNGKWVDDGFTSAGSANGSTVWINKDEESSEAASTLFHEVVHTNQPSTLSGAFNAFKDTH